nr:ubiquitin hydrolase [Tanacetum cinerariifolium]
NLELIDCFVNAKRSNADVNAKHSRENDEVNTASVYTASSNVPTASVNITTASISHETACAYIASQSSGSQIKFEDINQINEDDMEEMDIKWNMAFLSMRADNTENKVFDNSLCLKDCKKNNNSLNSKITDLTDKLFNAKNMIYHYKLALAQVESRLVEYKEREVKYIEKIRTLEFYDKGKVENIETLKKELETLKQEKEVVDGKLASLLSASKDLDNLIESQRSDKSKEGLGYTAVPLPVAQLYLSPKKDLSWTGLPDCADDTVTDYSRPSPTVESSSEEDQKKNPSAFENVASPITPKQFVKFVKASDSQSKSKTDEKETPEKLPVKNAEQYRKPNKKPNVRGNQRNWNNLKSHQLGPDFVMKKKACFNCGDFNHLAYEKFPTGSTKGPTADMGIKEKAVKSSACWSWKPSQNLSNKGPKNNSVSVVFKKYTYIDTQGRLKSVMAWVPKENYSSFEICRAVPIIILMTKDIGTVAALGT